MKLHVAFASDENYVPFLGTSILSLLENNQEFGQITVHILSNNISEENKSKLSLMIQSYYRKCLFYDISDLRDKLGGLKVETIAISAYARLYLSQLLPTNIDRVLYLDCDSLVVNSLKELWSIDIMNNLVAGVEDIVPVKFKEDLGLKASARYINSGMMLMNLSRLRKEDWITKINKYISCYTGEIPHHDQGVINALFKDEIQLLKPKFNCMTPFFYLNSRDLKQLYSLNEYYSDTDLEDATSNPIFVHLTQSYITRPWVKNSAHPFSKEFLKFLRKTPWYDYALREDNRTISVKFASLLFKHLPLRLFILIFDIKSRLISKK